MKKLYTLGIATFSLFTLHAQNTGIGTPTPISKLEVASADSSLIIVSNTSPSSDSAKTRIYFRNNGYFTGAIGTHVTNNNNNTIPYARLGFFTFGSTSPTDLRERMTITDEGRVGINTLSPTAVLDVNGSLRIRGTNPGAGKVLTSDANGLASWQTSAAGLTLPYAGSMSAFGDAFTITKSGFGSAIKIEGDNSTTLYSLNTGATGSAALFSSNTTTGTSSPVVDMTNYGSGDVLRTIARGTGVAGRFLINNTASSNFALLTSTDGLGASIGAFNYGSGPALIAHQGTPSLPASGNIAEFQSNINGGVSTVARITRGGRLFLAGGISISDGTQSQGRVLTSDGAGNATWQPTALSFPYSAVQPAAGSLFMLSNSSTTGTGSAIMGSTSSTAAGSVIVGASGLIGESNSTSPGLYAAGVRGINRGTGTAGAGVLGYHMGGGEGVYGESAAGYGVHGQSEGVAVYASSTNGYGLVASSNNGMAIYALSNGVNGLALRTGAGNVVMEKSLTVGKTAVENSNNGVYGYSVNSIGISGESDGTFGGGVVGEGIYIGVSGKTTGTNAGRQGVRGDNNGASTGWAGYFNGNVQVQGTLSKTAGSFIIDHPTDPANKYLVHSFVESPDMKNIYDGVTTTDANGKVTVTMPEWFQALNMDFRYQLTCINQFAQAIIFKEMSGNQFVIKTDKPNVKISWQVTGTRNDVYAREQRLPVEKEKAAADKGKYIYPQGYGYGQEKSIAPPMPAEKLK